MSTYLLTYRKVYENYYTEPLKMRVKNCSSELDAKIKLDKYVTGKDPDVTRIIVDECKNDDIFSIFGDIFGFGSSNPFNFK